MILAIAHRRAPWLGARHFPRAPKAQAGIETAGRQGTRRGGALRQSLIVRRNLITILFLSFSCASSTFRQFNGLCIVHPRFHPLSSRRLSHS